MKELTTWINSGKPTTVTSFYEGIKIKSDFETIVRSWIEYKDRPEFSVLDKKSKLYYIIERMDNKQIEENYKKEQGLKDQINNRNSPNAFKRNTTRTNGAVHSQKEPIEKLINADLNQNNIETLRLQKEASKRGENAKNLKARETFMARYASKITEDRMLQLLRKFNQIQLENAFGSVLFAYHNKDQEENTDKQPS